MNDIEILEEFLEDYIHDGLAIQYRVMEAIENLIQRNKDLEQIEKEHKEENGKLRKENINLKEKIIRQQEQLNIANKKILAQKGQLKVVNNSYIPKSKIKELLEVTREEYKVALEENSTKAFVLKCQLTILQELLEESEK